MQEATTPQSFCKFVSSLRQEGEDETSLTLLSSAPVTCFRMRMLGALALHMGRVSITRVVPLLLSAFLPRVEEKHTHSSKELNLLSTAGGTLLPRAHGHPLVFTV